MRPDYSPPITPRQPATADPRALPAGYPLGGYTIERVLGRGGFAFTYLASSLESDGSTSEMAVKELFPTGVFRLPSLEVGRLNEAEETAFAYAIERFEAEARALIRCRHPNVVRMLDFFFWNRTAYIIMVYEHGENLEEHIGRWRQTLGPLSETHVLSVLLPLLDGLELVHGHGIFHRDVKPGNIYLTTGGRPVLLDFGAAKHLNKLARDARSLNTYPVVSDGYSPFEQYWEGGAIGAWTDLYAIGATVHAMITGKPPPKAGQRERFNRRRPSDPYVPLAGQAGLRRHYSSKLLVAVDWALRCNIEDRPQTVAQWRHYLPALPRAADQPPLPPVGSGEPVAAGSGRKSRWWFWGTAAATATLGAAAPGLCAPTFFY